MGNDHHFSAAVEPAPVSGERTMPPSNPTLLQPRHLRAALLLLVGLIVAIGMPSPAVADKPLNVLLIVADEVRQAVAEAVVPEHLRPSPAGD